DEDEEGERVKSDKRCEGICWVRVMYEDYIAFWSSASDGSWANNFIQAPLKSSKSPSAIHHLHVEPLSIRDSLTREPAHSRISIDSQRVAMGQGSRINDDYVNASTSAVAMWDAGYVTTSTCNADVSAQNTCNNRRQTEIRDRYRVPRTRPNLQLQLDEQPATTSEIKKITLVYALQ
ncbi:hypothetical protein Tco_0058711, partial [Tanacetum coccineum]